ncbi:MAG: helicase-related protein [Candidatus Helarchaeota archaeon]
MFNNQITQIRPITFILYLYSQYFKTVKYQLISSIYYSKIKLYSFQNYVALRILSKRYPRFILADEVGLGKTIETGIILKDFILKRNLRKILILVPPTLQEQWKNELKNKFNIEVYYNNTINGKLNLLNKYGNQYTKSVFLLSHYDVRYNRISSLLKSIKWDLIIVDEAHHIRRRGQGSNNTTILWKVMNSLINGDDYEKSVLFLTATPQQIDSTEFFYLIEILKKNLFSNYIDFENHIQFIQQLRKFSTMIYENMSKLKNNNNTYHHLINLEILCNSLKNLLKWNKEFVIEATRIIRKNKGLINLSLLQDLLDLSSKFHKINQIMIRNRKFDLISVFPELKSRNIEDIKIEMSQDFKNLYNNLTLYVDIRAKDIESKRMFNIKKGYIRTIYEQLFTSCLAALKVSLERRIHTIEENLDEYEEYEELMTIIDKMQEINLNNYNKINNLMDDKIGSDLKLAIEYIQEEDNFYEMDENQVNINLEIQNNKDYSEISEREFLGLMLEQIRELERDPSNDRKYFKLKQLIIEEKKNGINHFIIFVKFIETQKYLQNRLDEDLDEYIYCINGTMNINDRQEQINDFKKNGGILISTEVSGEGMNLQFCNYLINYDLPWNPMKLEQRIGRIDRIGQTKIVFVRNLIYKDTVSERKYNALLSRHFQCQINIGLIEPILDINRGYSSGNKEKGIVLNDIIISNNSYNKNLWELFEKTFFNLNFKLFLNFIYLYCREFSEKFKIIPFLPERYRNVFKVIFRNENLFNEFERFRNRINLSPRPDGPTNFSVQNPKYYIITDIFTQYIKHFGYSVVSLEHPLIKFMIYDLNEYDYPVITTIEVAELENIEEGFLFFYLINFNFKYSKIIPLYITKKKEYNEQVEKRLINIIFEIQGKIKNLENLEYIDTSLNEEDLTLIREIDEEIVKKRISNEIQELKKIFEKYFKKFGLDSLKYKNLDFNSKLIGIIKIKRSKEESIKINLEPLNFDFSNEFLSFQKLDFNLFIEGIINSDNLHIEILLNSEILDIIFNEKKLKFLPIEEPRKNFKLSIILPPVKQKKYFNLEFVVKNEFFICEIIKKEIKIEFIHFEFLDENLNPKKCFNQKEKIKILVRSIREIPYLKLFKIDLLDNNKVEEKIINVQEIKENPQFESLEGVAKDYSFTINENLNPGLYKVKAIGEESNNFIVIPDIEVRLDNNKYRNIIIQPLDEIDLVIKIGENNSRNILRHININVYNGSNSFIGKITNLINILHQLDQNLSNFKISLKDLFESLNPPIINRFNSLGLRIKVFFLEEFLKELKIDILPEINFYSEIINNHLLIENDEELKVQYQTSHNYEIRPYIKLYREEDFYYTFAKKKIICMIDELNRNIIINFREIKPGIPYRFYVQLTSKQLDILRNIEIEIGSFTLTKNFHIYFNNEPFLLKFKDSLLSNQLYELERTKFNEFNSKFLNLNNQILQNIDIKLDIKRKYSRVNKLKYLSKKFTYYDHIFFVYQYDILLHPNLIDYISKYREIKNNIVNINILPYPCPTDLIIKQENWVENNNKILSFFPLIPLRCPNCKSQDYYFIYNDFENNLISFCKKCSKNEDGNENIDQLNNNKIIIPIKIQVLLKCSQCNSPLLCGLNKEKKKIFFFCQNCKKYFDDINITFKKYLINDQSFNIISLKQLKYLINNSYLISSEYFTIVRDIEKQLFSPENVIKVYRFLNENYPDDLRILVKKYGKIENFTNLLNRFGKIKKDIYYLIKLIDKTSSLEDFNNKEFQKYKIIKKVPKKNRKLRRKKKLLIFIKLFQNIIKIIKMDSGEKSRNKFKKGNESKRILKNKIKELKKIIKSEIKEILDYRITKEILLRYNQNKFSFEISKSNLKNLTNIFDAIKKHIFTQYKYEISQLKELKKEIESKKEEWKKNIYLYILKLIREENEIEDVNEDIFTNMINIEIDFEQIDEQISDLGEFESINKNVRETILLKCINKLFIELKRKNFINQYLEPINFNINISKIKNFKIFNELKPETKERTKILFIFDDILINFKTNFSFNFNEFPNIIKTIKNNFYNGSYDTDIIIFL